MRWTNPYPPPPRGTKTTVSHGSYSRVCPLRYPPKEVSDDLRKSGYMGVAPQLSVLPTYLSAAEQTAESST